ncbi:MAG: ATP-grasp domain-containing protein [Gemmatimonadota bacterium]
MRKGDAPIVAVATHGDAPAATEDDGLALSLLADRHSLRVEAVPWDARSSWDRYAAVLVRSTWDYHRRPDEFLGWATGVEAAGTALWNPAEVVRWNADKTYLRDLEAAGVAVVPTRWMPPESDVSLLDALGDRGWEEVVVKPSVGATAYRTRRLRSADVQRESGSLADIPRDAGALIQPFLPEVCSDGEWSFMYFDDGSGSLEFSHAVVKRPASGDFRVQDAFGGTVERAVPPGDLLRQVDETAATVSRLAPGPLLYARIDGVVSDGMHGAAGTFLLMEAELIEPVLFLARSERAPDRFAEAIARRIGVLDGRRP